jgi:hypothetical protein
MFTSEKGQSTQLRFVSFVTIFSSLERHFKTRFSPRDPSSESNVTFKIQSFAPINKSNRIVREHISLMVESTFFSFLLAEKLNGETISAGGDNTAGFMLYE